MRRLEFLSTEREEFDEITGKAHLGYLGIIDTKGYPRIVPLNFVAIKTTIFFHGAAAGEKYDLLSSHPKSTFSVDLPFAFIPSYWQSKKSAEPTSYFFKSLHIRGEGSIVENLDRKAEVLQAMMEKYQPEGRHDRVESDNPIYRVPLQKVGVYQVSPEEITMKLKFGQNYSDRLIQPIIEGLTKRDLPMDRETVENIKKYRTKTNVRETE